MRYTLSFLFIVFFFTGCGKMVLNYAPSSTMIVKGNVEVGEFKYLPMVFHDVKPNQIRNTAIGSIIFEKNISDYYEKALFNESRLVGINISGKNYVYGEIKDFLIDDLGYSIDWKLLVNYKVKNETGSVCYDKDKLVTKNTSKFINVFGSLNEVMKLNIEKVFADKDYVKCIN